MSFFVNTMVCGFSLYQILAFFLIYSCLGWCLEVIYAAVSTGQLVNRGFLNGPVCPIYGFGCSPFRRWQTTCCCSISAA